MKYFSRACLGMLLAASALSTTAHAQEAEDSDGITISGSATVVSDYRFRGFSQSNEEAAIQGGFSIGHDSGLYSWDILHMLCLHRDELWQAYLEKLEQQGASRDPALSPPPVKKTPSCGIKR